MIMRIYSKRKSKAHANGLETLDSMNKTLRQLETQCEALHDRLVYLRKVEEVLWNILTAAC